MMDPVLNTQEGLMSIIQEAALTIQETPDGEWTGGLLASRLELLQRY